jgi:hypothetical protein
MGILGYSGVGGASDTVRGRDLVAASVVTVGTFQFIYELVDVDLSRLSLLFKSTLAAATYSIEVDVCIDRVPRAGDNQTEASDVRPATWFNVSRYAQFTTTAGVTAALAPSGTPASVAGNASYLVTCPLKAAAMGLDSVAFLRIKGTRTDANGSADSVSLTSFAALNGVRVQ